MRYRPGAHRSFRPRHRHWLRGLLLAVLVLAVLFLLYGCAVQRLIYSSRGTMIFLRNGRCSEQQKRDDCRRPSGVGHISN